MGNVFENRELIYVVRWSVFLIDISCIFFLVSYLLLSNLDIQINSIGHQNGKILSVIEVTILAVLKLKPEKGIMRHIGSFDFFKTVWFSASPLLVFLGLNCISHFVLDQTVYLSFVLFLFFSVFLMFKMAAKFFKEECVRKIPHRNIMIIGLDEEFKFIDCKKKM